MAQQTINNGDDGVDIRSDINNNFTELYTATSTNTSNFSVLETANYEQSNIITTYGDSVTEQGLWQPKLLSKIPMIHENKGLGGSRISGTSSDPLPLNSESRITDINIDSDIIIVNGGINDWAQSVDIGTVPTWGTRINLVNPEMDTENDSFINWTDGALASGSSTQKASSYFFPVPANTTLILGNVKQYAFYDSSKVFSTAGQNFNYSNAEYEVTTGALDVFIRVSTGVESSLSQYDYMAVYEKTATDEFITSTQLVVEKLTQRFKTARIIIAGTTFAKYQDRGSFTDKYGILNEDGKSTYDYSEALRLVAKLYGLPFLDWNGGCGWNDFNAREYVKDDGTTTGILLHPNDAGAERMAELLYSKLKELQNL